MHFNCFFSTKWIILIPTQIFLYLLFDSSHDSSGTLLVVNDTTALSLYGCPKMKYNIDKTLYKELNQTECRFIVSEICFILYNYYIYFELIQLYINFVLFINNNNIEHISIFSTVRVHIIMFNTCQCLFTFLISACSISIYKYCSRLFYTLCRLYSIS